MNIPIRPENISDSNIAECVDEYIKRINAYINVNIKFSQNGPFCYILLSDISSYITPLNKELTNRIVKDIKVLYEKFGWIVSDDTQPNGARYLTFSSNVWKDKNEI